LNFETLQELDLSSNWFGIHGLEKFSESFTKFNNLKKLNLNNNKLCTHTGHDTRPFRDVLIAVAANLTDLSICENSIEDSDMVDFLIPAIAQMQNLKSLNVYKNRLSKIGTVGLYHALLANNIHLHKFNISANQLLDEGLAELLPLVLQSSQLQMLNLTSTRVTIKCEEAFVAFFEQY
jgi:Ran GTPase-activating protein (RanGAP) involved in mRNA processing and transport